MLKHESPGDKEAGDIWSAEILSRIEARGRTRESESRQGRASENSGCMRNLPATVWTGFWGVSMVCENSSFCLETG